MVIPMICGKGKHKFLGVHVIPDCNDCINHCRTHGPNPCARCKDRNRFDPISAHPEERKPKTKKGSKHLFVVRWLEPHKAVVEAINKREVRNEFNNGNYEEVNAVCDDPQKVTIERVADRHKV